VKIARAAALALIVAGLASCREEAPRAPSPAALAQREAAYRQACVAGELAAVAEEDLEVLEALVESLDPADPAGELGLRTTFAAFDFARAYHGHAELRARAYAYLDSAVNHAATTADSARYIERAGAFSIRRPEEGTVEANVLTAYQANFSERLADDDHPCNWDLPF
jgi:hypothetical protein